MASFACVLCFSVLIKVSNRNLVGSKGQFSLKCEMDDLHVVVHPSSQYVCFECLGISKRIEGVDWNMIDLSYPELAQKKTFLPLKKTFMGLS